MYRRKQKRIRKNILGRGGCFIGIRIHNIHDIQITPSTNLLHIKTFKTFRWSSYMRSLNNVLLNEFTLICRSEKKE